MSKPGTQIHLHLSVKSVLHWPKKDLKGLLITEDGKRMTADEAFDALLDELTKGNEVLPMGDCDNFDFKKGCMGHPVEEGEK